MVSFEFLVVLCCTIVHLAGGPHCCNQILHPSQASRLIEITSRPQFPFFAYFHPRHR
ncbi:hypothetical protein PILCRDRAFT_819811 [Piloderma croceum F 1598]|uniref:Secreted protein n=1 Tax=Piloderma croceum (strain F 1598) TaxID=765440 RepID=A0A0C3FEV0_PILCF|nr:hypothetical protein PILCRDRAFT_819811 [Piloderma croceum F 1598]